MYQDTKDYIHQFYPQEQISADDLVRQYGSVAEALEAMRSLGQLRLYKLICKYYPDESAQYIKAIDDGQVILELDLLSVIPYDDLMDQDPPGIVDDIMRNLFQQLNGILERDDVKEYIELADNWIIDTFINDMILEHDAINIAVYLRQRGVIFKTPTFFDAGVYPRIAARAEELFHEKYIFQIIRELALLYPQFQEILFEYANREQVYRKVILEQAISDANEQLLRAVRFNRNDDVKLDLGDSEMQDTNEWFAFADYLVQTNPALRRPLAIEALLFGLINLVEHLGFDFFELAKSIEDSTTLRIAIKTLWRTEYRNVVPELIRIGIINGVLDVEDLKRLIFYSHEPLQRTIRLVVFELGLTGLVEMLGFDMRDIAETADRPSLVNAITALIEQGDRELALEIAVIGHKNNKLTRRQFIEFITRS